MDTRWCAIRIAVSVAAWSACNPIGRAAETRAGHQGLLAHWSFDEESGGEVGDVSGNGNVGRIKGGVTVVEGIGGKALKFNGEDGYVECPVGPSLESAEQTTIEAWIYPMGAHQNGYGGIINNVNGAANTRLLVMSSGKLLAQLHGSTEGLSGPNVVTDLWNHVAYVYDGKEEIWYLNGKRYAVQSYDRPLATGARAMTIGWGYTEADYYHFNGLIDEVMIYGRALSEEEVLRSYKRLSHVVEAELAQREAEMQRKIEAMDFVDHGVPVVLATRRGVVATCDAEGRPLILICTMDNYKRRLRSSLLVVDVERGTTEQHWHPSETQPIGEVYSVLLASTGRFYTAFGRTFLEFDPTAREWTFSQAGPGLVMCFTEAPDGTIYGATCSGSHLISFDPKTRAFTNYGQLDLKEKYPRSLAVDDAGWVYCGIGVARGNLVAFNPATKERRQIPAEDGRQAGSGYVYRGTNGKAYGYAHGGGQRYELFDGKATPVEQFGAAKVPMKTGSQGTFLRSFPDGRRIVGLNLAEKWVEVTEPDSGKVKRIVLEYKSEGPGILSIIAGPDGRIHGSTGLPLHFFAYDPENDYLEDWGGVRHGAHFNALALQGHWLAGAAYCGGHLSAYDMTKPWTNERGRVPNPKYYGNWSRDLTRPAALLAHPDGEHVIMGGMPAYGHCGGGLLIYNLATEQSTLLTHKELIPWHSTFALRALPNGDLVGGTSISPGTGGHSVATEGALYVMDWASKKIVFQTPVGSAKSVRELAIGPDGLVYGFASNSIFFVFDPQKRETVHQEDLAEYGTPAGGQAPRVLALGPDRQFYALFSKGVIRIEPGTFKHELIAEPPVRINAGIAIRNGRIYFSSGSHLCSCKIGTPPEAPAETQDLAWATLRSGPGVDRTVFALRTGDSPVPSQNSFVIDVAGKWLATDPQYRDVEWPTAESSPQTANYNTVLVDGIGPHGAGGGRLLESFHSPHYSYVVGDATDSYPSEKLSRFRRHVVHLKPDHFFVIDELASPEPTTFEWRLHTDSAARMTAASNCITVKKAGVRLDAVVLEPAEPAVDVELTSQADGSCCAVKNRDKAKELTFLSFLYPRASRARVKGAIELTSVPIAESSGQHTKVLGAFGASGVFYRGKAKGDFITFEVPVAAEDDYRVLGTFFGSSYYGVVQLSIDGRTQGAPYDGYAKGVALAENVDLGPAHLSKGRHRFRFEVVGQNPASKGFFAGIVSLRFARLDALEQVVDGGLPEGLSVESLRGSGYLGALVKEDGRTTRLILNLGGSDHEVQGDGLRFTGRHAAVRISEEGEVQTYVLHAGTRLTYEDQLLLESDRPCSVSLGLAGQSAKGVIKASEAGDARIHAPRLKTFCVRGRPVDLTDTYNREAEILTLRLRPGAQSVSGEMEQP